MGTGYDISASTSSSSSAAGGASQLGGVSINNGSTGVSWTWILIGAGALAAVWFFFIRRKRR